VTEEVADAHAHVPERRGAGWRVRGISMPGYQHLRDGIECQDAYRHVFLPAAGAYVLAVADGAGSRVRAAEGAALAVGLAVHVLGDALDARASPAASHEWHRLLEDSYGRILSTFYDVTSRIGPDVTDFAATLTATVLSPPWLGVVSLGDCFLIARAGDGDNPLHLLDLAPPAGEYANETVFLTSARAPQQVTVACLYDPELSALILATDGLAPIGIEQDGAGVPRPNRSFVEPVLGAIAAPHRDPTELARLLLDDRLSARSGDDKTLLCAVRT
jgi:hypothetical protein